MRKLSTIQRRGAINVVLYDKIELEDGTAAHSYVVKPWDAAAEDDRALLCVQFQTGPRGDDNSSDGVLDADLLEMVRDRLTRFQDGPYACPENAHALRHVEEALMWLAKRAEDRFIRQRAARHTNDAEDQNK